MMNDPSLIGFYVIIGIMILICIFFCIRIIKNLYNIYETNKKVDQKKKEIEQMKANGDFHNWIYTNIGGKETHVCEKTGYCPEFDGFLSDQDLEQVKVMDKLEKDFKLYREQQVGSLAKKYNLSAEQIDELAIEIEMIKHNFIKEQYLKELNNMIIKE